MAGGLRRVQTRVTSALKRTFLGTVVGHSAFHNRLVLSYKPSEQSINLTIVRQS